MVTSCLTANGETVRLWQAATGAPAALPLPQLLSRANLLTKTGLLEEAAYQFGRRRNRCVAAQARSQLPPSPCSSRSPTRAPSAGSTPLRPGSSPAHNPAIARPGIGRRCRRQKLLHRPPAVDGGAVPEQQERSPWPTPRQLAQEPHDFHPRDRLLVHLHRERSLRRHRADHRADGRGPPPRAGSASPRSGIRVTTAGNR